MPAAQDTATAGENRGRAQGLFEDLKRFSNERPSAAPIHGWPHDVRLVYHDDAPIGNLTGEPSTLHPGRRARLQGQMLHALHRRPSTSQHRAQQR